MTCQECKARLYPENPESIMFMPGGRVLRPLCESCEGRFRKIQPARTVIKKTVVLNYPMPARAPAPQRRAGGLSVEVER